MTLSSFWFYLSATRSDRKRDAAIPLPAGVTQYRNISYGSHGNDNLLDVYLPEDATDLCPPSSASMAAVMFTAPRKSTAVTVWTWPDGALPL